MNKSRTWIVLAILGAGAAVAHDGMHGPGAKYDADGSGDLSLAEYTEYLKATKGDVAAAARQFAKIDANQDGKVSSAEFLRGQKSK